MKRKEIASQKQTPDSSLPEAHPRGALPRLRFPEFEGDGEWDVKLLRDIAILITDRAGTKKYILMSVTSGIGLIPQIEKFGREIAGNAYKNYLVIQKMDFAFNKSATKQYPEGYISMLRDYESAALPNSIFTCFRLNSHEYYPFFFDQLFQANHHGQWLRRFISVGARAHGSLNVDSADLFSMPLYIPQFCEQQKIADCLSSLDDLIAAHNRKLDALKTHKKGLMQQLFPVEGETVPRLRFPEFEKSGEWFVSTLGLVSDISSGATPLRSNFEFYCGGSIPWVKTLDLNNSFITKTEECITEKAKARINPAGSVLVAMYGGFNQIGRTGLLRIPAATNQAISVLVPDYKKVESAFLLIWLNAKVNMWKKIASSSRKDPNITSRDIEKFPILFPSLPEQQKIAECLLSLDSLIAAEAKEIESLKVHKKGLMQALFPDPAGADA